MVLVVSMILVLTVVVALYQLYFFLAVHREELQVVQAVWVWIHRVVRVVRVVLVALVSSMNLVLTVVVALHHHYQLYFFLVVHWVVLVVLEVWEDLLGARVAWTIHQVVLVVLVVLAVLV